MSVCPSGCAFATISPGTVPPGLLSTITCCPKREVSPLAMSRAVISPAPPIPEATMRIGLLGNVWAAAVLMAAARHSAADSVR